MHRKLGRFLREYDLYLRQSKRGHHRVEDADGHYLVTIGTTPSCPYWAENAVNQLVKMGCLPEDVPRKWRR